jgi:hypothetical protein
VGRYPAVLLQVIAEGLWVWEEIVVQLLYSAIKYIWGQLLYYKQTDKLFTVGF